MGIIDVHYTFYFSFSALSGILPTGQARKGDTKARTKYHCRQRLLGLWPIHPGKANNQLIYFDHLLVMKLMHLLRNNVKYFFFQCFDEFCLDVIAVCDQAYFARGTWFF